MTLILNLMHGECLFDVIIMYDEIVNLDIEYY